MRSAAAGFSYFLIAFAAAFLLGTVRTLWLAPAVGEMAATLIELPVILALAWAACLFVLRRMKVAARTLDRSIMGAAAFAFLIVAEIALGQGLMDRTLAAQVKAMTAPAGLVGLAGQALFGLFPLIALAARR